MFQQRGSGDGVSAKTAVAGVATAELCGACWQKFGLHRCAPRRRVPAGLRSCVGRCATWAGIRAGHVGDRGREDCVELGFRPLLTSKNRTSSRSHSCSPMSNAQDQKNRREKPEAFSFPACCSASKTVQQRARRKIKVICDVKNVRGQPNSSSHRSM